MVSMPVGRCFLLDATSIIHLPACVLVIYGIRMQSVSELVMMEDRHSCWPTGIESILLKLLHMSAKDLRERRHGM